VEIGIAGDSAVVSRVAATMALPKGPLWKEGGGKLEGKRERKRERARERDGGRRTPRERNTNKKERRRKERRSEKEERASSGQTELDGESPCKKTAEDKGV